MFVIKVVLKKALKKMIIWLEKWILRSKIRSKKVRGQYHIMNSRIILYSIN